jgi:single-strand selective monofunctional uracil DNA glycosylase
MDHAPAGTPLARAAERLRDALAPWVGQARGEVAFTLNPLDHAWEPHRRYLERFGPRGEVAEPAFEAVFVGMNPGPWGMAQTGVPFGSPDVVREVLGISGPVRPVDASKTHASRPVLGFESARTEVSGQRVWGAVRDCFGEADLFFRRFFVLNYCPLVFQAASGRNVTPDKAPRDWLAPAFAACDEHLAAALLVLRPRTVIGVGLWAEKQATRVVAAAGLDAKVASILHPSPASPAANRGWLGQVRAQLAELGHPWPEPGPRARP